MNNKLPLILGGCVVVLLLVCCVGAGVIGILNKDQLAQALGKAPSPSLPSGNNNSASTDTTSVPSSKGTSVPSSKGTAVPPSTSGSAPSGSGNPFLDALTKAKGATKYQIDFSMAFGGMEKGKYQESPFMSFSGKVDGDNSDVFLNGGLLSSLYTTSGNGKVEILDAGGTEYLKGASSLMGVIKLDPNTWYISNQKSASSFKDIAKPDQVSTWTSGGKLSDFQKVRSESLDNQSCDVYLYDLKSVKNAALVGLLGSSQSKSNFDAIDKAEVNLWVCGDGYLHKYNLDYEGHSSADATQKGALKMSWHVWDVNGSDISVQAPSGAKPMPTQ